MSWEMCLILFSVFTGRAVNGWEGFCLKCVDEDIDWQELMKVQRTQIWTVFHSFPNQPPNNDCGLTVATIINNKVCHMCTKKTIKQMWIWCSRLWDAQMQLKRKISRSGNFMHALSHMQQPVDGLCPTTLFFHSPSHLQNVKFIRNLDSSAPAMTISWVDAPEFLLCPILLLQCSASTLCVAV